MNLSSTVPHSDHNSAIEYHKPLQHNPASDPVLEMLLSNAAVEDGGAPHILLEGSWNGLFLNTATATGNCMDDSFTTAKKRQSGIDLMMDLTTVSNKKMGHTSFSDLGVYDAKANQQHALQRVTEGESIDATKTKVMRLRLERIAAALNTTRRTSNEEEECSRRRLHNSDSALLRKHSNTDTTELQGAWYRAKHPKMMINHNSAPAGSILFSDFSSNELDLSQ